MILNRIEKQALFIKLFSVSLLYSQAITQTNLVIYSYINSYIILFKIFSILFYIPTIFSLYYKIQNTCPNIYVNYTLV